MASKTLQLNELREITFWIQLNKALLRKKQRGQHITKKQHKYLQKFCFDNQLYSKMKATPFVSDVPLALMTTLSGVSFLTIQLRQWNNILGKCFNSIDSGRQLFNLDIQKALGDTYGILRAYDKKYHLVEDIPEDDEKDDKLAEIISEYMEIQEKEGLNIPDILQEIYSLKSSVLTKIMAKNKGHYCLKIVEEQVLCVINEESDKLEDMNRVYIEEYCKKTLQVVKPLLSGGKLLLHISLITWGNPIYESFVDEETGILELMDKNAKQFITTTEQRIRQPDRSTISICNVSPLGFLANPLPPT
jgi:hypothetical protein